MGASNFLKKIALGLGLLASLSNSKLTIYGPEDLKSKFVDGSIKAVYSNFGQIPYGQSMVSFSSYDF